MKPSEPLDDFSAEEQARLAALPHARLPAAMLEKKIITALKANGQLRQAPTPQPGSLPRLATASLSFLLIFMLGFLLGRRQSIVPVAPNQQAMFMLLLYESPEAAGSESDKVVEYSHWAKSLREANRAITGEKLKDGGRLLRQAQGRLEISEVGQQNQREALGGYFLIEARDIEDALRIAERCPHLKYGGAIELRQIDKI